MKTKAKSKPRTTTKSGTKKTSKKQGKKKVIAASIAIATASILGYFGWKYWKKKKEGNSNHNFDAVLKESNNIIPLPNTSSPVIPAPKRIDTKPIYTYNNSNTQTGSDFPLKKGSKGTLVKELQDALLAKYGKSVLPKYGADGDFGSETVNALRKLGFPTSVDQSTFNVITAATKIDVAAVGKELYNAVVAKNYNAALSSLKKLRTTDDYAKASSVFKDYRINGVHQTLVNGLFNTFSSSHQKDAIRMELLSMGLQYDGNKWSLSGLGGLPSIITTEPATVWVNAKESVNVPSKMVLGNEVSKRLDYTLFENGGKYFLVNTKSVKYLN